jgi:2-methylcitrate dehydratase PrpD
LLTETLARYIAEALSQPLPEPVAHQAALHLLDAFGAMVSGSRLPAGKQAPAFVQSLGGTPQSTVVGSRIVTTAINAALANGMLAHADETDDSHAPSLTHPGCSIVPAAFAVAEREGRSGRDLLRAVTAGYDVGTRVAMALGGGLFLDHYKHSSHAFGGLFGATAAAAALSGLDAGRATHALAYAVQLASGIPCWLAHSDRIEKAFLFGGMPAQGGVQAASMAAAGFTGSVQALEGNPGLLTAFPDQARPERAIAELGSRFEVVHTSIKKWSVGSPIQSALNSLETLIAEQGFGADDIAEIVVELPPRRAEAVDNRPMPDVNLQHQLSLMLTDGKVTFASAHDHARMDDPALRRLRARIRVVSRPDAKEGGQAHLTVRLTDGRRLEQHTPHVRGTPGNPMTTEEVVAKARDLILPVLGPGPGETLIQSLLAIESLESVAALRQLLQP